MEITFCHPVFRSNQPEVVISSMVTTMKLVIDESEEIQTALASYLLQKARNEERVYHFNFLHADNMDLPCPSKEGGSHKLIFLFYVPRKRLQHLLNLQRR